MGITTSELPNLIGKVLVVQVTVVGQDDEDYREVRGKCLVANDAGLVIQTRSRSEMIKMAEVIDVDVEPKVKRLTHRWLGEIDDDAVRQHLLDRHGMPYDLIKSLDERTAVGLHDKINHAQLGHRHEEKPHRSAGRPKRESE
jgi:hypothetical protein